MSDQPQVVQVRGEYGALFERTVPTEEQALQLWNEQIAKGQITIVTGAEWVEVTDAYGTYKVLRMPGEEPATSRGGRAPRTPVAPIVEEGFR